MSLKDDVVNYCYESGYTEDEVARSFSHGVYIARELARYAHRGQKRKNGIASYFSHPFNCYRNFTRFIGVFEEDPESIDRSLLDKYNIPYLGVQEVCLLHDVVEDTAITFDEIRVFYEDVGLLDYFEKYIADALKAVTHDDNMPYNDYIEIVKKNRIASMVKLMDLVDNTNILQLATFGDKEENRTINYIKYARSINDEYHFIENVYDYRQALIQQEESGEYDG